MSISFGNVDPTLKKLGILEYAEVEKKIKTEIFLNLPPEENGDIVVNLKSFRVTAMAIGITSGAVVGGIIGGGVGMVVAGPPGSIALGGIGVGLGGAVGGLTTYAICEATKNYRIKRDPVYKIFREKMILDKTKELFIEQLRSDDIFNDLCCPISFDIPEIPVLAPCNHIYNKESIEDHLDRNERELKAWKDAGSHGEYHEKSSCGVRQGIKFKKSDLVFKEDHIVKVMERCLKLREIHQKRGEGVDLRELNKSILLQGIDHILSNTRKMLVQIAKIQHNELLGSVEEHKGKVKYSEFLKAQEKIFSGKNLFEPENINVPHVPLPLQPLVLNIEPKDTHGDCKGCKNQLR